MRDGTSLAVHSGRTAGLRLGIRPSMLTVLHEIQDWRRKCIHIDVKDDSQKRAGRMWLVAFALRPLR